MTPELLLGIEPTVRLDLDNEPQPDIVLILDEAVSGQSRLTENGYLEGVPERVVEIAASSAAIDLGELPLRECSDLTSARNIAELFVKINDEVFRVARENNTFSINSELAQALQNAPEENVSIRLTMQNGETVDSEIGKRTVAAWKTIYTN